MQTPGRNKLTEEEVKDLRAWYYNKGKVTRTEEELKIVAEAYGNRTVEEIIQSVKFRR